MEPVFQESYELKNCWRESIKEKYTGHKRVPFNKHGQIIGNLLRQQGLNEGVKHLTRPRSWCKDSSHLALVCLHCSKALGTGGNIVPPMGALKPGMEHIENISAYSLPWSFVLHGHMYREIVS